MKYMSTLLYRAGNSGNFQINDPSPLPTSDQMKAAVLKLLHARKDGEAIQALSRYPFKLFRGTNDFNDEFCVLSALVGVDLYQEACKTGSSVANRGSFKRIAETYTEIGPFVRFVEVEFDTRSAAKAIESTGLSRSEIQKLVYKYLGVEAGYLADFSYQRHHDFYVELDLDINPYNYEGTTRERFTKILAEASSEVQVCILIGLLERYPIGSAPFRTQALHDEIRGWIRRLASAGAVPVPTLKVTSQVVERALADAEKLLKVSGASSVVDRVHTALHGYLIQVCAAAHISMPVSDPSLTQLYKALRVHHPKFTNLSPRAQDVEKILNSLAAIVDALNPIRNKASIAHPNMDLLPEAEAMLAINAVRTLLHYLDAKLQ